MSSQTERRLSRSSHETFSWCKRKGYWEYIFEGGYSGTRPAWALAIGIAAHEGMEVIAHHMKAGTLDDMEISAFLSFIEEKFAHEIDPLTVPVEQWKEGRDLAQALCLGWLRTRADLFMQRYEILTIEKEVETQLAPGIILQSRIDMVVRDKRDGTVWAWNWKTTGVTKDWTLLWEDDIQAKMEALATQENIGENVSGCIFEGLYKGGKYNGQFTTPLIYCHVDPSTGEVFDEGRKGRVRRLASEIHPGGLANWILFLDEDTVARHYVRSEPILKNDEEVRDWIAQVVREESDILSMLDEDVPEADRLMFFKQNKSSECRWCQFRKACRLVSTLDELKENGELKKRKDHHGPRSDS